MGIVQKAEFYLMRSVKNPFLKGKLVSAIAKNIGTADPFKGRSQFVDVAKTAQHENRLRQEGCTVLDRFLTEEKTQELVDYSENLACYDPFHRDLGTFSIEKAPEVTHVANYKRTDLVQHQSILEIANDPGILNIVQGFLGARPTISNINMWWSLSGRNEAQDAQLFHRDLDDFKFCKLFIYLTDVGKESGPHVYVKNSSVSPKLTKIRRYQDEEIVEAFGQENIVEFTGKRGSMFIVDTYGFHKGLLPVSGNRLILQVQYSLRPIGLEHYVPVKTSANGSYDKYINRLLIQ